MKNLILILIISCLFTFNSSGQFNHVPNGNFEFYTTCPTASSQMSLCTGWSSWNPLSPDYYNACFTGTNGPGVPWSFGSGYQPAASGNGYAGGYSFISSIKELITRPIIPLQVGATYEVSLSVSLANWSLMATNDIGVFFYDNSPTFYNTTAIPTIGTSLATAQVIWPNTIITDTQNWVRLTQIYTADSAYDNIAIGGFLPQNSMSYTLLVGTTPSSAYYLFDSVVVKLYDSLGFTFTDSTLCAGDTITVPYYSAKKKQSNNVFTLQLSNASGSFASPVNIGSRTSDTSGTITAVIPTNTTTGTGYRLRLRASNFADTSEVGIALKIGNAVAKPVANNNGPVCANDTLKLTATTATSGATFRWTGPNSFNSTLQDPKINVPLPVNSGNYIVTAILHGCEAKDTTTVVVNAGTGPTGTLATANTPVCANDTLKLFGTANGSGNSYSWAGPDNFTANTQNPVIPAATALKAGDYVLYASDGNCTSRDTVTVVIKPRPAAFSGSSNSPVCAAETINLSATSTSTGVTYAWTGPNGFNASGATPFIGGASAIHNGDYYVTATLNGCPLVDTVTVVVKPLPVKPVAGSNTPLCAGETLNLTAASSTGGVTYSWTGPNSFATTTQNPTITSTTTGMSGNYIVAAILNGCQLTDTATVLVKPMPAAVTAGSNSPVCAGGSLQLTVSNSTTGSTYAWAGPNSFTATTQNPTITNSTTAATGWYIATVDLNGCSIKDSVNATVHPIPATPVASYSNPLCVGETLNLSATNVAGATYSWTGIGGYTANTQNPTRTNMQFGDTGLYNVTATVNGCASPSGDVRVSINPLPFVVIFPTPGDTICVGDNATFTALPNNHGGVPQYQWYINGAPVSGSGTTFSSTQLAHGDVVRCNMTENTKCNSAFTDESNEVDMKVLPWLAPSVTFTMSPNRPLEVDEYVTFTATPTNAGNNPTYQWKRNGQNVQGATGAIWSANTLNDNDSISVEVISSYKCPQPLTGAANGVRVKVLSGIGDINSMSALTLYPNPNNGSFTLQGKINNTAKVQLQILNAVGQVVYTNEVTTTNGNLQQDINMESMANGIYLLKIQAGSAHKNISFRIAQ